MARWRPDAAERLTKAALDLFAERGFDDTTVLDIARRAELSKTTFFRHFQDKREVLFGPDTLHVTLAEAVAAARPGDPPLDAVGRALQVLSDHVFTPGRRDVVVRRQTVVNNHPELQEREALKNLTLTAAVTEALMRRGVSEVTARVAAQLGAVATAVAVERWIASSGSSFGDLVGRALREVTDAAQAMQYEENFAQTSARRVAKSPR